MQHRAVFGAVDVFARKHRLYRIVHVCLFRQRQQVFASSRIQQVLGIIQIKITALDGKALAALFVARKQIGDSPPLHLVAVVGFELLPRRQVRRITCGKLLVRHFALDRSCNTQDTSQ